jgi:DNA polymerase I-like protein with 3'-5' exonuclease and polymerase domains
MQESLFDKDHLIAIQMNEGAELEWHMPSGYPDLTGYKQIAIDLETCDPRLTTLGPGWARKDGFIVGVAVAAGDESWYFPIRHENGHNLDPKITMKWLKTQMATPRIDKIMHNATYDLGWLWAEGVEVQGRVIDTMITGAVVDENRWSYNLNNLGKDYLDERKNEKLLRVAAEEWGIDAKAEMWKLPPKYVGVYAEQDAAMTLRLWERLKIELDKLDLWSIWELETSLIPMMLDMRKMGVRVDLDGAEKARRILRTRKKEVADFIKDKSGVAIEPWAAASVQKVFDALNLQYPKTEAGAPSFTKQFLSAHPHEVAQAIVRLRETDKADSTFIDSILRHEHKGRIHTEFHQLRSDDGGTVTGRMSSSSPNLQQIPSRDPEIKKLIRGLFIPEEDARWGSFDYSSQEPRLLVHFAASMPESMRSPEVDRFVHGYQDDNFDFHQMVADIARIDRKSAKTCIAEGELVLTDKGLVPIEKITLDHLVWDGIEWVHHDGLVYQGVKEVLTYDGLTATADHEVWVGRERTLPLGVAASRLERLVRTGAGKRPVRLVDDHHKRVAAARKAYLRSCALRLWDRGLESFGQFAARAVDAVQELSNNFSTQKLWPLVNHFRGVEKLTATGIGHFSTVSQPKGSILQKLWGKGHTVPIFFGKGACGSSMYSASGRRVDGIRYRPHKQQRALHCGEYPLGYEITKSVKQARVYDIKNAGPRHRFTVSGVLVHNCGLGIMYGMGTAKLSAQLGISPEEGRELMDTFNTKVPFVKQLATAASNQGERNGQIRTILGRLCRFHLWEPRGFGYKKPLPLEEARKEYGSLGNLKRAFTYKALNKLIQGSAADQTKKAMADCYAEGLLPMLTVHDELCFSVESSEQAARIQEIMENGLSDVLKVPSKVDAEMGANWGEVG